MGLMRVGALAAFGAAGRPAAVEAPRQRLPRIGDRPVTRRGAWAFERSDSRFRGGAAGFTPFVPAAAVRRR